MITPDKAETYVCCLSAVDEVSLTFSWDKNRFDDGYVDIAGHVDHMRCACCLCLVNPRSRV